MARAPSKETIKQKFQNIFRRNWKEGQIGVSVPTQSRLEEFIVTPTLLKEINKDAPLSQRVRAIRDLCELVTAKRLEDNGVEALWTTTSDILEPHIPTEHRHLLLTFIKCLIIGQNDHLGLMRAVFFGVIQRHSIFEDLPQRLDVLKSLSSNGKTLLDFEEDMGPFLIAWMPDVISYGMAAEFLGLLVNVFKFNSCYLDDDVVSGLVRHTCTVCSRTKRQNDIEQSLKVLEAVVCYSCLPTESLYGFVTALCRTVSVEEFAQASWKLMRNLLGTHLGHSAIYTMCSIMENRENKNDIVLLRGAVFYVGMARWGSMRVQSLRHNFTSVLPSILKALSCKHPLVAYEVTLSLQRMVKKYGKDIQSVTWDIVLDIMDELFRNLHLYSSHQLLPNDLHDLLTTTEMLHETKTFSGSATRLFSIVEEFANIRPESSVLNLISFLAQSIHPTKVDWIQNLQSLMDRYFTNRNRTPIREAALRVLSSVISSHLYEDDLIEMVVLPQLSHISEDSDPVVRHAAVQLLVDVAQVCQTHRCLEILDIIQKVVMKPIHTRASLAITPGTPDPAHHQQTIAETDEDLVDIKAAVFSLMELFRFKLYRLPCNHSVLAFDLLVKHMQDQYQHSYSSETARTIRARVFEYLLELRSDSMYHIGLPDKDGNMKYSPYVLCCDKMDMDISGKSSPPSLCASPPLSERFCKTTVIPFAEALKVITTCLKYETDWRVLMLVSQGLAKVLQNRSLVLASSANLGRLCATLCSIVDEKTRFSALHHTPTNFVRTLFCVEVYRVLTALVPYHAQLDSEKQIDLIMHLRAGLRMHSDQQCAQQCVDGLTLCIMEMQAPMGRILPSVIMEMSRMSATSSMAVPVLEFLSSLIWFPTLYVSFVEIQYMSVFAVALHYTNPFNFSLYVVSLAHHVIAMWFIKCRLPFRREFVNCITRGLTNNSKMAMESTGQARLRRSSSLTDEPKGDKKARASKEILLELHSLLTEGCLDMMARYTYSNCTSVPKRSPVADFLLAGGQNQSWLLGNKVITITTSGGSPRMQKNGLCEKCCSLIQLETGEEKARVTVSSNSTTLRSGDTGKAVDGSSEQQQQQQQTVPPQRGLLRRQRSKSGKLLEKRNDSGEKSPSLGTVSPPISPPPAEKSKPFNFSNTTSPEMPRRPAHASSPPLAKSGRTSGDSHRSRSGAASPGSTGRSGSPVTGVEGPTDSNKDFVERVHASLHERLEASSAPKLSSANIYQCNCWCQGWAEVYVRRPTGNTAWIMRIENGGALLPTAQEFPLADISSLLLRNRELDIGDELSGSELEEQDEEEEEETEGAGEEDEELKGGHRLNGEAVVHQGDHFEAGLPYYTQRPQEEGRHSQGADLSTILLQRSEHQTKGISRSHSCPDSLEMLRGTSVPDGTDGGRDFSASPRTVVRLFQDRLGPVSTSYREMSFLERLLEEESTLESFRKQALAFNVQSNGKENADKQTDDIGKDNEEEEEEKDRKPDGTEETDLVTKPQSYHDQDASSPAQLTRRQQPAQRKPRPVSLPPGSDALQLSADDQKPESPLWHSRSHTISSGMPSLSSGGPQQPGRRRRASESSRSRVMNRTGLSPSFVFLQLYYSPAFSDDQERPVILPTSQVTQRAVKVLDRIPPYDTHKIGVVYVAHGQTNNQTAILSNLYGSVRYVEFLKGLGRLISLKDLSPSEVYTGGLDHQGGDGKFAYSWHDNIMQVIFHVATLMPNKDSDPTCNSKKLHIGNDFVSIVYNESNEPYRLGTMKGQFNFAEIIIEPLDSESNLVTVQAKPDLEAMIGSRGPRMITNKNLPLLVRQMALHANLASKIYQSQLRGSPAEAYTSNWLERLRQIKRLRGKISQGAPSNILPAVAAAVTSPVRQHERRKRSSVTLVDFADYA